MDPHKICEKIALHLETIFEDEMTQAEKNISEELEAAGYLVWDDENKWYIVPPVFQEGKAQKLS
jgi:hypothetical protein